MADLQQLAARTEWMMNLAFIATVILLFGLGFAAVYISVPCANLIKAVIRFLDAKTRAVQIETELGFATKPRGASGEAPADDAKYRPRM